MEPAIQSRPQYGFAIFLDFWLNYFRHNSGHKKQLLRQNQEFLVSFREKKFLILVWVYTSGTFTLNTFLQTIRNIKGLQNFYFCFHMCVTKLKRVCTLWKSYRQLLWWVFYEILLNDMVLQKGFMWTFESKFSKMNSPK